MKNNLMSPEMEALKRKLKSTWEAGDYGTFAKYLELGAMEFFDRLQIQPGTKMLDVACGAGQLTIPAAKRGIRVTAIDLAQNLVDQARQRAEQEGLDIEITQGDAEALPYPDASFDIVLSLIGSMFAPRPELVASEMIRVCRTGGKIIMGNWTPEGHVGQMFKIIGKYIPPPNIPSPLLWGREEVVRERFGESVTDLRVTSYRYPMGYPFSPEKVVDFFIDYYGPTNRAFNMLDAPRRTQLKADLVELWTANNQAADDTTVVMSEYVEIVGQRS